MFVVVFGALDWAAHSHVGNPNGFDGLPLTVAKAIDAEIGRLVARTDWPRTHVILVSDHGMARAEQEINLIRLLCDLGLLQLQRHKSTLTLKGALAKALLAAWKPAKRVLPADLVQKLRARSSFRHNLQVGGPLLTIDWDKTTVFPAASYGALRLGIRERPPGGPVPRKDAGRVRSEVMGVLRSAADPSSGRALFAEVLAADEVYHGPWMQAAPDILLKPSSRDLILSAPPWGGNLLLFMEEPGLIRPVAPALGTHTMDAMLVLSGERVRTEGYGSECILEDVAPTVLHLLGLPVPPVMDGRALTEHLADEPIASANDCRVEEVVHTAATYADEERLKARLQALGYL